MSIVAAIHEKRWTEYFAEIIGYILTIRNQNRIPYKYELINFNQRRNSRRDGRLLIN